MKLSELTSQDLETIKEKAIELAKEDYKKEFEDDEEISEEVSHLILTHIEGSIRLFCDLIAGDNERGKKQSLLQFTLAVADMLIMTVTPEDVTFNKMVFKCYNDIFLPVLKEYGVEGF